MNLYPEVGLKGMGTGHQESEQRAEGTEKDSRGRFIYKAEECGDSEAFFAIKQVVGIFLKRCIWSWRDGSAVKNTHCS